MKRFTGKNILKRCIIGVLLVMLVLSSMPVAFAASPTITGIHVDDITITQYTHGYGTTSYGGDKFYRYDELFDSVTVTYSDGSTEERNSDGFSWSDDQYDAPWGLGDHEVTVYYGDDNVVTTTFTVTITDESEVDYIEGPDTFDIYEKTSGYQYETYYRYSDLINRSLTVHMKNGDTFETWANGGFNYNDKYYSPYFIEDQSAENPWGVGAHPVDVYIMGYHYPITVNIVESPIEKIEAFDIQLIENSDGYITSDSYWDEMKDEWIDVEYYVYNIPVPRYKVYMKDGSVIESDSDDNSHYIEIDGEDCYISRQSDQSYQNHWTVNHTYPATIRILDKEASFNVTIIDTPVKSLDLKVNRDYIVGTGGYTDDDDEGHEYYYYNSYKYLSGTVTFKDGSTYEVDYDNYIRYNGQKYYFSFSDGQSASTPWGVGSHEVEVSVLNAKTKITVNITPSPVKSIQLEPINLIEGTGSTSYYDSKMRYSYSGEFKGTITMNDGTVITLNRSNWFDYNGNEYSISYTDDQDENEWGVGKHTAKISVLGFESTVEVNITPSPVKSITVKDITLEEYVDGSYDSWSESYRYHYVIEAEITFTDGTKMTLPSNSVYTIDNKNYVLSYRDDQSDHQWGVGTHQSTASFMGKTCTFNVTVTECTVKSIQILKVSPVTLSDRYVPSMLSFTYQINHKDGSSEKKAKFATSNSSYRTSYESNQNLIVELIDGDNWHFGKGNQFKITYAGCEASAYAEVVSDTDWQFVEQNGEIILTKYTGENTNNFTIPGEINEKPVVGIKGDALPASVVWLTLPDSVRYITGSMNYPNLGSIYFGDAFNTLDIELFRNLPNLFSVTISEDNPNYSEEMNAIYTKDFSKLIAVAPAAYRDILQINDNTKDIDVLKSDILKNIQYYIGDKSKYFTIQDGVTYTKDMKTVVDCDEEKTGDYIMPSSVEKIQPYAFDYTKLNSVKISDNVTDIAYRSFMSCGSLTKVTLPKNLRTIDSASFDGCVKLSDCELPSSLETIGSDAFSRCVQTKLNIPDSVKAIGSSAFSYNRSLESVTVGKGVSRIESSTFRSCSEITSVNLGSNVKEVAAGAFSDCSKLTDLTINASSLSVGNSGFYGCPLTNFTSWNKITGDIGDDAFRLSKATSVSFSNTVTSIAYSSFAGASELGSIKIPSSVLKVNSKAFDGSKWHKAQPDGSLYIDGVYYDYKGNMPLNTKIEIKAGTLTIADNALNNQPNMTAITLPAGIKRIGDHAISGTSVKTVSIPASVEQIGDLAFVNCTELTSINVNASNKNFKSVDGVLYNKDMTELIFCPKRSSESFELPASVKRIRPFAFGVSNLQKLVVSNDSVIFDAYSVGFDQKYVLSWSGYSATILYRPVTIVCPSGSSAEKYAEKYLLDTEMSSAPEPVLLVGDVDSDNVISVLDATRIQKFKASLCNIDGSKFDGTKPTDNQLKVADVDSDGVISVLDATRIQKYKAHLCNLDGSKPYTD